MAWGVLWGRVVRPMMTPGISPAFASELGTYRLIAKLARGGMGDVYLAARQGLGGFNKLLVLKELRPDFASDPSYVAMFLEEARLAARLAHPNIVQTNEVGTDGARHFMTMEYLDGRSLYRVQKRMEGAGGLPLGAHLRVIAEALLGLHYAHELRGFDGEPLGIVHRDVSPLNVFVTFDGQAKVLDFGIAKAADSSLETQAGVLKGRLAYMAPEQASGGRVDRRADLYAVGVMIWEAAAGRRLWAGLSDVEIFRATLGEGPPPLLSVCPDAPPALAALCARAMAHSPEDRHPTAAALLEELDLHLAARADAASMRELGAMVGGAFAVERTEMSATIEEALFAMRTGPASGVVSTRGAGVLDAREVAGSREDLANLASLLGATPSIAQISEERPKRVPSMRPALPTLAEGAARAARATKKYRQGAAIAAGAAAIGAIVALGVIRLGGGVVQSTPAAAPQVAAAPVPELAPPLALTLAPSPALAPTPAPTPALAPFAFAPPLQRPKAPRPPPPDSARAALSVELPSTPAPAALPSPAAVRPEVDPAGGRAPLRAIVTSNPYGAP